jgi:hypothetical protein
MTDLLEALQGISSSSSSNPPASKAAAATPFMLSMPPLGSVRSLFNFPQEYLPLLHQPRAVSVMPSWLEGCCYSSACPISNASLHLSHQSLRQQKVWVCWMGCVQPVEAPPTWPQFASRLLPRVLLLLLYTSIDTLFKHPR